MEAAPCRCPCSQGSVYSYGTSHSRWESLTERLGPPAGQGHCAHTLLFLNGLIEILFIHDALYLLEVQWNGFGLHIINSSRLQ